MTGEVPLDPIEPDLRDEAPPTHLAPHFDIVLDEASVAEAARLRAVFGPPEDNPFKRRRR